MAATETLLKTTLSVAVPLWIRTIQTEAWTPERMLQEAARCAQELAEHGDQILFRGKQTAQAFNALALGLAVAAHAPGGVHFLGMHFEAAPEEALIS